MKKITIGIVTLIVTTGLIISGLELFSSYNTSGIINRKAPVQTRKTIAINASPQKIWTIMSRIDEWEQWYKEVQSRALVRVVTSQGNSRSGPPSNFFFTNACYFRFDVSCFRFVVIFTVFRQMDIIFEETATGT